MDREALNKALLEAHHSNEITELVLLYAIAGDEAELRQDIDAACFYLTQAFVFALEAGGPEAERLNKRLADKGRAKLLEF